jgi:ABC-type multidrug transport system ATPase subunit
MELGDIVIWGGLLVLIESVRGWLGRREAQRTFGDFTEVFNAQREKHPVTAEALEMEELVKSRPSEFAVKCEGASQLFFDTSGEPIPAVNQVTLGVEQGSVFGFLGANGARKCTLLKIANAMLPSAGTISNLGRDIEAYNDPTQISVCPQLNWI